MGRGQADLHGLQAPGHGPRRPGLHQRNRGVPLHRQPPQQDRPPAPQMVLLVDASCQVVASCDQLLHLCDQEPPSTADGTLIIITVLSGCSDTQS